ncbi:ninja-family protein Os03g0419100-like [Olea europaea var. sylvestris]|uniref:ninja-family protein Os03g0419100-like n=1 Tax=Olea europaea var. sylvestris TaxID=158386 RepID=UPI000C1D3494|nr:ninja-family protein Os03g0419100-like [Olea europaea var. sylvestris]
MCVCLEKEKSEMGHGKVENDENEEIELSLWLSMNGRFSVNPKMAVNKLKHSSSISNLAFTEGAGGVSGFGEGGWQKMGVLIDLYTRQMRTCSLPIEAKKELRKRKELQSMRWIEAKRKRFEKLKNGRLLKKKNTRGENSGNCNLILSIKLKAGVPTAAVTPLLIRAARLAATCLPY